jgi:hypothetical protein
MGKPGNKRTRVPAAGKNDAGSLTATKANLEEYCRSEHLRILRQPFRPWRKPAGSGVWWGLPPDRNEEPAAAEAKGAKRLSLSTKAEDAHRRALSKYLDGMRRHALDLQDLTERLLNDLESRAFAHEAVRSLRLRQVVELLDALPDWFIDEESPAWRVTRSTPRLQLVSDMPEASVRAIAVVSLLHGNRPGQFNVGWTVARTIDEEMGAIRKAVSRLRTKR